MKISVSGPAVAHASGSDEEIRDPRQLKALDGLRYEEDLCANYLDRKSLLHVSIVGGAIALTYNEDKNELRVVSEFWAPRALSPSELDELMDDTQGQWSDGIGEACFDAWETTSGIHVDLSPPRQYEPGAVSAHQMEDGRTVPRFAHLPKAYWYGNVDIIQQALSEHADLNALYDGSTTLGLALQKNDLQTAGLLIEGGADVNRGAPLAACAFIKEPAAAVQIARLLLGRGADIRAANSFGETPLEAARKRERTELVALLLEAGAKE